jgi:hypothetical protein
MSLPTWHGLFGGYHAVGTSEVETEVHLRIAGPWIVARAVLVFLAEWRCRLLSPATTDDFSTTVNDHFPKP